MVKIPKAYISGKITGLDLKEAFILFSNIERELIDKEVFNPMKFTAHLPKKSSWSAYMVVCIETLIKCDEIHMLPNWKDSRGALIEHDIAKAYEMKIFYP